MKPLQKRSGARKLFIGHYLIILVLIFWDQAHCLDLLTRDTKQLGRTKHHRENSVLKISEAGLRLSQKRPKPWHFSAHSFAATAKKFEIKNVGNSVKNLKSYFDQNYNSSRGKNCRCYSVFRSFKFLNSNLSELLNKVFQIKERFEVF